MDTAAQLAIEKMLGSIDIYRASALHLSVGNPPMMRVAGRLVPVPDQPIVTPQFINDIATSWLTEAQLQTVHTNRDLTIAKTFDNHKRFRISVFYQQDFLSVSLNAVPDTIPQLQATGLPDTAQRLVLQERGLVLLVGPVGSGSHTTWHSYIQYLNDTAEKHIVTIEDPVDFLFTDNRSVVEQRSVGHDVASVAHGIEFVLQEDVDVVAVASLPDAAAIRAATQAVMAGKVVFALMPDNTIVSAFNSLLHAFSADDESQVRQLLADTVVGVINHRTVHTVTGEDVLVSEVLVPDDTIRAIIQKGELWQINNALYTSRDPQIISLDRALRQAVESGQITRAEALAHAQDPATFMPADSNQHASG